MLGWHGVANVAIAKRKRRQKLLFDPKHFSKLSNENHRCTSDPVEEQNCIAYAAGDEIHYWWPPGDDFPGGLPAPYFWPRSCPPDETIESFVCAYALLGFEECDKSEDGRLEDKVEKLALFAKWTMKDGKKVLEPTHAAIQSPSRNGKWRSKMGEDEDIEHDSLTDVAGKLYGDPILFLKRTMEAKKEAVKLLKKRLPSY